MANDGIWVKVYPPGGGGAGHLPGLGGWAEITAVTGSPTKHQYTDADGTDWVAYKWTGNGSVTTTDGVVDVLLVGPGYTAASNQTGGFVNNAVARATAATHMVTIGQSPTTEGAIDFTPSRFGTVLACAMTKRLGDLGNGGASPTADGVRLNYTGTTREYGAGGGRKSILTDPEDRYGIGGDPVIRNRGGDGVVIVRVPATQAKV